MAEATSRPASTQNLHDDEPRTFDATKFAHDPWADYSIIRHLWMMRRNRKITAGEADYLLVTDDFVRMGSGGGCWASVEYMSKILKLTRRQVQIIRQSLLKKGYLIHVENRPCIGGLRPVFHTSFRPSPVKGAMDCAPPLRAQWTAPHKNKKKTKDIKTSGDPPAAGSPPNSKPSRRAKVFVQIKSKITPESEQLARALHQKLKQMPIKFRQTKGISAPFPSKVWPEAIDRFIKAKWYGGVTAVKQLFARLMICWDRLPENILPCHPKVFTSAGENYVRYKLEPALKQVEKTSVKIELTPDQKKAWAWTKTHVWPGELVDVKRCLLANYEVWPKIRKALVTLSREGVGPIKSAAKRVFDKVRDVYILDVMRQLAEHAQYLQSEFSKVPDYDSAAYSFNPADLRRHKVFANMLDPAKADAPALIIKLQEMLARG